MRPLLLFCSLLPFSSPSTTVSVAGPITDDFQKWLNSNGYAADDFARLDYGTQGSFGGKTSTALSITRAPVIFVHGNTDTALQTNSFSTGFTNTISYFLGKGFTTAELYVTSWGNNERSKAGTRTHSCHEVSRLRRFAEAVMAYTGTANVSFISHSMGVTLARKIIKGGNIEGNDGSCSIGAPLSKNIDVFVGLAGANYGMCNCEGSGTLVEASCNKKNGFWPGDSCGMNKLTCGLHPLPWPCNGVKYSKYLMDLNADPAMEANYIFSVWSTADDIIMYNDMVWGNPTSLIPRSTGNVTYKSLTHMQTKENTAGDQYIMITEKKAPYTHE